MSDNTIGFLDSFPLWHRIRGHKVHRGFNIINPISRAYWCETCDKKWEVISG